MNNENQDINQQKGVEPSPWEKSSTTISQKAVIKAFQNKLKNSTFIKDTKIFQNVGASGGGLPSVITNSIASLISLTRQGDAVIMISNTHIHKIDLKTSQVTISHPIPSFISNLNQPNSVELFSKLISRFEVDYTGTKILVHTTGVNSVDEFRIPQFAEKNLVLYLGPKVLKIKDITPDRQRLREIGHQMHLSMAQVNNKYFKNRVYFVTQEPSGYFVIWFNNITENRIHRFLRTKHANLVMIYPFNEFGYLATVSSENVQIWYQRNRRVMSRTNFDLEDDRFKLIKFKSKILLQSKEGYFVVNGGTNRGHPLFLFVKKRHVYYKMNNVLMNIQAAVEHVEEEARCKMSEFISIEEKQITCYKSSCLVVPSGDFIRRNQDGELILLEQKIQPIKRFRVINHTKWKVLVTLHSRRDGFYEMINCFEHESEPKDHQLESEETSLSHKKEKITLPKFDIVEFYGSKIDSVGSHQDLKDENFTEHPQTTIVSIQKFDKNLNQANLENFGIRLPCPPKHILNLTKSPKSTFWNVTDNKSLVLFLTNRSLKTTKEGRQENLKKEKNEFFIQILDYSKGSTQEFEITVDDINQSAFADAIRLRKRLSLKDVILTNSKILTLSLQVHPTQINSSSKILLIVDLKVQKILFEQSYLMSLYFDRIQSKLVTGYFVPDHFFKPKVDFAPDLNLQGPSVVRFDIEGTKLSFKNLTEHRNHQELRILDQLVTKDTVILLEVFDRDNITVTVCPLNQDKHVAEMTENVADGDQIGEEDNSSDLFKSGLQFNLLEILTSEEYALLRRGAVVSFARNLESNYNPNEISFRIQSGANTFNFKYLIEKKELKKEGHLNLSVCAEFVKGECPVIEIPGMRLRRLDQVTFFNELSGRVEIKKNAGSFDHLKKFVNLGEDQTNSEEFRSAVCALKNLGPGYSSWIESELSMMKILVAYGDLDLFEAFYRYIPLKRLRLKDLEEFVVKDLQQEDQGGDIAQSLVAEKSPLSFGAIDGKIWVKFVKYLTQCF